MNDETPPNRGDRSFRAFLGIALWVILAAALICVVALLVVYLRNPQA